MKTLRIPVAILALAAAVAWFSGPLRSPTTAENETTAIPHVFRGGTPAKATEVNDNFTAVVEGVNRNVARMSAQAGRIGALEGTSTDHETRIAAGEATQGAHDGRISANESTLEAHARRIAANEEALGAFGTAPNTIIVSGGEGSESVAEALASITDANAENRYIVRILPGVFDETELLRVRPYVHLQGSGEGVTVVRANRAAEVESPQAATLQVEDRAAVSDLTVINSGNTASTSVAIYANNVTPNTLLRNLSAEANGVGGVGHFGLYISEAALRVENCTLRGSGGSGANAGLGSLASDGSLSKPTIVDSRLEGVGAGAGFGVQQERTSLILRNCDIQGSIRGIVALEAGVSELRNCRVETIGTTPCLEATGDASFLCGGTLFVGGNTLGAPESFKYAYCIKSNFDPVENGTGSLLEP